jgi:hypothetical protein
MAQRICSHNVEAAVVDDGRNLGHPIENALHAGSNVLNRGRASGASGGAGGAGQVGQVGTFRFVQL